MSHSPTPCPNRPLRLLVVDDHTLFRRGLTALLQRDPCLTVVGDASDANQAQQKAADLQPDVILLDNHLPGVRGVDAITALRAAAPHAQVLILTVSEDEDDLAAALRNGAAGYLLKTMEGDELTSAIERAHAGDSVIAPAMLRKMVAAWRTGAQGACSALADSAAPASASIDDLLSPRERDVLRGIAQGLSNKEIARQHQIAETTVKIHVQHLLRKLGVSSRVHAAVWATERGLG